MTRFSPELHRGVLAKHPRVLSVRPLAREDLAKLAAPRAGPPRVKAFRDSHHRLARLVAAGVRPAEIARISGYSQSRLTSLGQDPAFEQLVTEYRGKVDQAYVDSQDEFYNTATQNMLRAERMIEQHLDNAEDENELIPLRTLLPLVSDRADRFGYGKHSTQTNEVKDFAKMMEQMAAKSGRSNVIDAKAVPVPPLAPMQEGGGPEPAAPDSLPTTASTTEGFR